METCSGWLLRKFREWETSTGGRQTVSAFARYLGVKQPSLNRWMNSDSVPDFENAVKISQKLGTEIFEILNLPVPSLPTGITGILPPTSDADENARQLIFIFQNATPERRAELLRYAQYLAEQEQKQNSKDTTQTLKAKTQLR